MFAAKQMANSRATHHIQQVLFGVGRTRQLDAARHIGQRQCDKRFRQPLDVASRQRAGHQLHQTPVAVALEHVAILGRHGAHLVRRAGLVGVHQLHVRMAERLHEARDHLRRVLGYGDEFAVQQQRHQHILFVRLQHDVRHGNCRRCHGHLEAVQCPIEVLDSGIDHAAVVVVEQKVPGVGVLVIGAGNRGDVLIEQPQRRSEQLGGQADLEQVGVHGRQLTVVEAQLGDGSGQHTDGRHWRQIVFGEVAGVQVAQVTNCEAK